MKPRLYTSQTIEFRTNGVGVLADAISCISRFAFGSDELEVKYPVTGLHFSEICRRAILMVRPDPIRDPQPYRIYRITKPMAGVVTIYARHLVYDLQGIVVQPFTAGTIGEALQGLKSNAVTDLSFEFWTDKETSADFSAAAPSTAWSLLGGSKGSILDVYGGEYQFDGNTVRLWERLGEDRGVSIRYGKNLRSLEQDENCEACYTGVVPFWVHSDTGTVTQLPEIIIEADGDYGYTRILPLDLSAEFETEPTEAQLRTRAERYMTENSIGEPAVSWKIEFVQLEQTEEYKGKALLERVCLGDTVHVEFTQMGVSVSARAVQAVYDCLMERYDSVTLGSVKQDITDTLAAQKKDLEKKPDISLVRSIAMQLTAALLGAKGGAVRLLDTDGDGLPDELYIADNADPEQAVKVWRWNYEGWAGSKAGYGGPFTMGATLADGLLAEAVTAAHLVAGTIQSKDGETFYLDLDNGVLKIKAVDELSASIDETQNDVESLGESTSKQITEVVQTSEGIILTALQDYVKTNDYEAFQETVSSQFQILNDQVAINLTTALSEAQNINNALQEQINQITTYFRFTEDGQYIGRSDSEMQTRFANAIWEFLLNGVQQLYIDPDGVHGRQIHTDAIYIGNLAIQEQPNGDVIIS